MRLPPNRPDTEPFRLYRNIVTALLISAVLQLITGTIPSSLSTGSPEWYDRTYMVVQALAGVVSLVAFRVPGVRSGLNLERVGCVAGATVTLSYWIAVWFQNDGPPLSSGVWIAAAYGYFCIQRLMQIRKIFIDAEG